MPSKKSSKQTKQSKQQFPVWVLAIVGFLVIMVAVFLLQQGDDTQTKQTLPREVSVAQASQLRDQGAFILDVREPSEWEQVHIPGATLIPLGELPNRISEVPADKEVVVVCRSGNRSQEGRDILLNAGLKNVTSMAGGMNDWAVQGLPIEKGK